MKYCIYPCIFTVLTTTLITLTLVISISTTLKNYNLMTWEMEFNSYYNPETLVETSKWQFLSNDIEIISITFNGRYQELFDINISYLNKTVATIDRITMYAPGYNLDLIKPFVPYFRFGSMRTNIKLNKKGMSSNFLIHSDKIYTVNTTYNGINNINLIFGHDKSSFNMTIPVNKIYN